MAPPPEHMPQETGRSPAVFGKSKGTPDIEFDYRKMKVKVDSRGTAKLSGTLSFSDLEKLPQHSQINAAAMRRPNPKGIVKWTGVRFSEIRQIGRCAALASYGRFVASDGYVIDEDMATLMHPKVMLAWMINDKPIPPENGATASSCRAVPLRRAKLKGDPGNPVHRHVIPAAAAKSRPDESDRILDLDCAAARHAPHNVQACRRIAWFGRTELVHIRYHRDCLKNAAGVQEHHDGQSRRTRQSVRHAEHCAAHDARRHNPNRESYPIVRSGLAAAAGMTWR